MYLILFFSPKHIKAVHKKQMSIGLRFLPNHCFTNINPAQKQKNNISLKKMGIKKNVTLHFKNPYFFS